MEEPEGKRVRFEKGRRRMKEGSRKDGRGKQEGWRREAGRMDYTEKGKEGGGTHFFQPMLLSRQPSTKQIQRRVCVWVNFKLKI